MRESAAQMPDPSSAPAHGGVTVLGHGLLADRTAAAFGVPKTGMGVGPTRVKDGDRSLLVVASDGWDTGPYPAVRALCAEAGRPWLPVRTELGRAVLGPVEVPGRTGCGCCAEMRRRLARRDPRGHDAVMRQHRDALASRPSSWLTGLAADLVAALVVDEATALAADPESARTRCALLYVQLDTLRITTHAFLPDPLCPQCGDAPEDRAPLARITVRPRPKTGPDRYRVRAVASELDVLMATYVDDECGVVSGVTKGSDGGLMTAAAAIGLRDGATEFGYGRTRSYQASELVALLEALERYGGTQPGGKRTVVRAPYSEVRDDALDPRTLGLYPPQRYRLPGFPFRPFTETTPYRWVWGYSFARSAPILVPENYAYYRVHHGDVEQPRLAYEISNGCALGSCLEEAILYGILEVAERDAFLMTWYGRMPVPRIDLCSARDPAIPQLAEAIRAETGYQILAFDSTLEQGVPCVWAMAVHPGQDGDLPKAACAAGSHLDPEHAVQNALSELGPLLTNCIRVYPRRRDRIRAMAADPSLVTSMEDHRHLYCNPAVFHRLRFLTRPGRVRGLSDMARVSPRADLSEDLCELVRRYRDSGLDIVVVDQTAAEHRAGRLACVKVIIPGTLPMTFGHTLRRVHGLPRLLEVPHLLGYRSRPLESRDVNPHPHPFP